MQSSPTPRHTGVKVVRSKSQQRPAGHGEPASAQTSKPPPSRPGKPPSNPGRVPPSLPVGTWQLCDDALQISSTGQLTHAAPMVPVPQRPADICEAGTQVSPSQQPLQLLLSHDVPAHAPLRHCCVAPQVTQMLPAAPHDAVVSPVTHVPVLGSTQPAQPSH